MKEVYAFKHCNPCLAYVKPNIEAHFRLFLGYSEWYIHWFIYLNVIKSWLFNLMKEMPFPFVNVG